MADELTGEALIRQLRQENARLLAAERRRRQEVDTLTKATAALISARDLNQVLEAILDHLEEVIAYDSACVFLLEGDKLLATAGRGFHDPNQVVGKRYPSDDRIWSELRQTKRPICLADAQRDPRFLGWGGTEEVRGWMGVPLLYGEQIFGYLTLDNYQPAAYGEAEVALAMAFANQAAAAIENARLFTKERRQRAHQETLQEVVQLIGSSLELDQVLRNIAQQLLVLMNVPSCNIMLLEPPDMLVWQISEGIPADWAAAESRRKVGQGLSGWVAQERRPLAVFDVLQDERTRKPSLLNRYDRRAFLGVPMEVKDELIGVLSIYDIEPRQFSKAEIKLLVAFAGQVAVAVTNARLFEQVQNQTVLLEQQVAARTDALLQSNQRLQAEISQRREAQEALADQATAMSRRALQLQVASEVARDAAVASDLSALLRQSVQLICDRFELYFASIWLADEAGQEVSLQASTGWTQVAPDHSARIDQLGAVGQAISSGEPQIISDVQQLSTATAQVQTGSQLVVPLSLGVHVLGALDIHSREKDAFDEEDVLAFGLLAGQLAVAIVNSRLLVETRRRVEELGGLHEISQALTSLSDVREVFGTLVERMAHLVGSKICVIALYEAKTGRIHAQEPGYGISDAVLAQANYLAREARDLWDFEELGPFLANSTADIPDFFQDYIQQFKVDSALVTRMQVEKRTIGLVFLVNKPGGFDGNDARLLDVFAGHAAVVIENTRLFNATHRQLNELKMLHEVSLAGAEASHEDTLIERATELLGQRLFTNNFGIMLLDEGTDQLRTHPSYRQQGGTAPLKLTLGQGVCGWVAQNGRPLRSADVTRLPFYYCSDPDTRSELCVPLIIGERVIGIINAESPEADAFNASDERFLITLAGQLATAIEKIRLLAAEKKRANQQHILAETAGVMLAAIDPRDLWPAVSQAALQVLGADRVAIYTYDSVADRLSCPFAEGLSASYIAALNEGFRHVPGHRLLQSLDPIVVSDVANDPTVGPMRARMIAEGFKAYVVFALHRPDVPLGGLVAYFDEIVNPGEDDLTAGQTLAHIAAVALQNSLLFAEINDALAREQRLNQIARTISRALDLPTILSTMVQLAVDLVNAGAGALAVLDAEAELIHYPYLVNLPESLSQLSHPPDRGLAWEIVNSGQSIMLSDYAIHPRASKQWVKANIEAFLGVPIAAGDRFLGALGLFKLEPGLAFSERDRDLAESVGRQAGVAIENARLYAQAQERADELADALARQEELDRLKSELIQNISHELRTPLAIVQGYTDLLQIGEFGRLSDEQLEPVRIIDRRIRLLTELVTDFTLILSSEMRPLVPAPIDLKQLVEEAISDFSLVVRQVGLELEGELAEDVPLVSGDATQLRRVMDNLVGNALKFTPAGGTITIRLYPDPADPAHIVLVVADTGIGIPADKQPHIFNRFYQVDGSITRKYGGTGLGLALVAEVVRRHQGEVSVKSESGQGTAFTIRIPALAD